MFINECVGCHAFFAHGLPEGFVGDHDGLLSYTHQNDYKYSIGGRGIC